MQTELKQRLIGAAVLVALAVIFLPMLIKGPAPESGASDVSLELPDAPQGEYVTRELPLVTPAQAPPGGVVGMDTGATRGLPTVDTTEDDAAASASATDAMRPPPTADGDYAVSFGSYASEAGAGRVVAALRASQLPGYQEAVGEGDRTLYRVRVGPFASRATAESARLRAAHVRDDVESRVVVLDAATGPGVTDQSTAATTAAAEPSDAASEGSDPPASDSSDEPVASQADDSQKNDSVQPESPPSEDPSAPVAAAAVGFAVQVGAFNNHAQAIELRDRARAAGFTVFVEQVPSGQGSLTRVQVGPVIDRAAAEQLQAKVAARLGVDGFVHSHP